MDQWVGKLRGIFMWGFVTDLDGEIQTERIHHSEVSPHQENIICPKEATDLNPVYHLAQHMHCPLTGLWPFDRNTETKVLCTC